ncbi:MAG: DUF6049 family protein [Nitriliruptoraceae bacterium]
MSRERGRDHVAVGSLIAVVLSAVLLVPASAQEDTSVPSARLTVTDLTRVLGPGTAPEPEDPSEERPYERDLRLRVVIENDGQVPLSAAQLVIEVHPSVHTRGTLAEALDGDLTSNPLHIDTTLLRTERPLPEETFAGLTETITPEEVAWADGAGGVHPVRIAVIRGTEVLDEAITAVVWLNRTPQEPLLTTFAWPIDTSPWRTASGSYPAAVDREVRPGSRLDRLVTALERGPSTVPVVLAPAAHLLEDLSDRSDGYVALERSDDGTIEGDRVEPSEPGASGSTAMLRRLRDLAGTLLRAPVSSAYADADLAALLDGNELQGELAALTAADGRRRLQRQLGVEVDGATHLVGDRIDDAVLDVLPGETLLLPADATSLPPIGADPDLGSPVRSLRAPSGRLMTALVGDPYLEVALENLDHPAGAVVASQRVLAESALAYLTAPGTSERGLVLLPSRTWDPPAAAAEELLLALTEARWLQHVPPNRLATEGRRDNTTLDLADPEQGAFDPAFTTELTTAWQGLDAAVAASPPGTSRLDDRPIEELRDDLLRATSRWYRDGGEGEATAIVRDVQRRIGVTFGGIEVGSDSVTLTSDTGQIPVTVQRTRGGPLLVTVTVQSQGRLLWPDGRTSEVIELDDGSSQTVSFSTRALSTGTFPVTVIVTDPTGSHELVRDTFSVRSTAISRPALTAIAVLVVVLLLVGALRRRRPDRPRLAVVRDTDGAQRDDHAGERGGDW